MTVKLTPTESETIFHNALCNGLGYVEGYGIELDFNKQDYARAVGEEWIIKKSNNDEYVSYDDSNTSRIGGYSITHNRDSAEKFLTKKDAQQTIDKNNLELHLMSEFNVEKYAKGSTT